MTRKRSGTSARSFLGIIILGILAASIFMVASAMKQKADSPDTHAQTADPQLRVQNVTLMTASGSRFIVEGVNVEFYRDNGCSYVTQNTWTQRNEMIAKMKQLGINAVRINYNASWLGQGNNFGQFSELMALFAQHGIYVMPSDHSYTGKALVSYATTSFPLFKKTVEHARVNGYEKYLIMNPYNEPYGEDENTNTWPNWISANKETLNYLRNDLAFKGVVVLDTRSWAAAFDIASQKQVQTHDASLMGGVPNVVFSNHWYPNIGLSNVDNTTKGASSVPVLIGELGQYNATPDTPQYVRDVFARVIATGIPNGHNGVFPWMWNWCDSNNMTAAWDDLVNLSTYGQLIVDHYYSKVSSVSVPPAPTSAPSSSATPTPSRVVPTATSTSAATPTPTRTPTKTVTATPKPTAVPSPKPNPTQSPSADGYPRQLSTTNSKITFVEYASPKNGNIFLRADVDSSINANRVEFYINGKWKTRDIWNPYFLGGENKGYALSLTEPTEVRVVVYYNLWNYVDGFLTYYPKTASPGLPVGAGALRASYELEEEWPQGYCAKLVIQNTTNTRHDNWTVSFRMNQGKFTSFYGGTHKTVGDRVEVIPSTTVRYLPASGTNNAVDFCAEKTGTNWRPSDFITELTP